MAHVVNIWRLGCNQKICNFLCHFDKINMLQSEPCMSLIIVSYSICNLADHFIRAFFCCFSEMLLMFHKILLQGFHQRIAKWPVVVISKLLVVYIK